jgi:hypothetical protein
MAQASGSPDDSGRQAALPWMPGNATEIATGSPGVEHLREEGPIQRFYTSHLAQYKKSNCITSCIQ